MNQLIPWVISNYETIIARRVLICIALDLIANALTVGHRHQIYELQTGLAVEAVQFAFFARLPARLRSAHLLASLLARARTFNRCCTEVNALLCGGACRQKNVKSAHNHRWNLLDSV